MPSRAIFEEDDEDHDDVAPRKRLQPPGLAGWLITVFIRQPIRTGAVLVALVVGGAIVANAIFFQAGPHPAPIMATRPSAGAKDVETVAAPPATLPLVAKAVRNPVPVERPPPAVSEAQIVADIQKGLTQLKLYSGPADGKSGPLTRTAITTYQKNLGLPQNGQPSVGLAAHIGATAAGATPAAAQAAATAAATANAERERLIAVQTALNQSGYGPVKVDGVMSKATGDAIRRFELDHGLPVTGLASDRLYKRMVDIGALAPA
ncbi:MAG: peptidoglycan-binding domain-containing protein [Bauldia sp.]